MRRTPSSELERFLEELAETARPGDRVPPIRDLMRRFGASQVLVQRSFQNLKDRGLISSEVGRGTYFHSTGRPAPTPAALPQGQGGARSVLLLRRSISIMRGRALVEGLQRRFTADGHRVLEVSYTDPEHARTVLRSLTRLDACVIQSSYKTVTVDLLAALRERSDVLAIDGAALMGADVEVVGMEWGEPLAAAIARLMAAGHARVAYATTSTPFLANQLGLRRFASLKDTLPGVSLHGITLASLPDGDYAEALVQALVAQADAKGHLPFSALVAWGIEDGARFRAMLETSGIAVPAQLSVVLLGRTDMPNEHGDFFDVVGCSVADQVDTLHEVINARWADASRPYGVSFIPVTHRTGQSVGAADVKAVRRRAPAAH